MKILVLPIFVLLAAPSWTVQTSGVTARLRGVSAVSERVAWASGSGSTVLRTMDGGLSWQKLSVTTDVLDFRDIDAIDAQTMKSRAKGPINKSNAMPGAVTTTSAGKAGGTANTRGTGDLRIVGPSEVDGVDRSDVPEEYRDHVRQYFQP